jgi:membrane protease YdiL (CAAX protease family)
MKLCNLALLFVFILLRTYFDTWMRSQDMWLSYGIEGGLCAVFVALNFRRIVWRPRLERSLAYHALAALGVGVLIAVVGVQFGWGAPFDFHSPLLWVQLVLVAPVLEEALFRLLAWEVLSEFLKNTKLVLVVVSLGFALSHFAAYFYVPDVFKGFVIYQSVYTFFLALHWGWARMRYRSWLVGVGLHFCVNLAFGLSMLLMQPL